MKKVVLVKLTACSRCQRGIAFLSTEDAEVTFGVPLDAYKVQEISPKCSTSAGMESLTVFLLQLSMRSSYFPCRVVLDCTEGSLLFARIEMIKEGQIEVFSCSTTEGVGFAAAAGVPLYVTDSVFEHSQSLHAGAPEEDADLVQPKVKVTLH